MITITIFALTMPPSPMFEQRFAELVDADRYEAFWRRLGQCHVRRDGAVDSAEQPHDVPLREIA